MFRKASVKLTATYLAIIMLISLFFSFALYRLSVRELNKDLSRQTSYVRTLPGFYNDVDDFLTNRTQQIVLAKAHIVSDLMVVNLVILTGGAFLSYFLARRTLEPIEKAHQAQSRFAADASHELRTPIAAMRSETEVSLMDSKLTLRQAKDQLNSNLEELDKLTYLTNSLLRLAQTDETSLDFKKVDTNRLVTTVIKRYAKQAKNKRIKIEFSPKSNSKIWGDADMISEALATILDNAIKYSPDKSSIVIEARVVGAETQVSVGDQGIGISKPDQEHMFERFYRSDQARTQSGKNGYGLGLSIAKQIIDVHHGRIHIKSQPGSGTTVTISTPKKSEPS